MQAEQVGPYRILDRLGAGGMGVVYRAEDTRLGRQVALKFLPESASGDPAALERFQREARAASALNHPNICTLFDIGEQDGRPYLVLELLEGQPLSAKLAGKPLPLAALLDWALEAGTALEAAHAKGVVHRDVKPANLFVTSSGLLKILDFGLAKLAHGPRSLEATATIGAFETAAGAAAGTVSYMSPEQARGEELDARTDIFSFGLVLYEMATGRQAFAGATSAVIFDAILNRQPPAPVQLNPALPDELSGILGKALEKDRKLRYQSIAELLVDLQRLKRDSTAGSVAVAAVAKPRRRWAYPALSGIALLAVTAAWFAWPRKPPAPREVQMRRITARPPEAPIHAAAISHDGKYLAYADRAGLHLLVLATKETQVLSGTRDLLPVAWSADGTKVICADLASGSENAVAISILAGVSRKPAAAQMSAPGGKHLLAVRDEEIWLESSDGTRKQKIGRALMETFPSWSPDARFATAVAYEQDTSFVRVFPTGGGAPLRATPVLKLPERVTAHAWLSDNRIVYAVERFGGADEPAGVYAMHVDKKSGAASGDPVRLAAFPGSSISWIGAAGANSLAVLRNQYQQDVYVAEVEAPGRIKPPRRLTLDERDDTPADWWPDSRSVLFRSTRAGRFGVYRQALDSDSAELLVSDPAFSIARPKITGDGRWLVFMKEAPGRVPAMFRMPATGGTAEKIYEGNVLMIRCPQVPAPCVFSENAGDALVLYELDVEKGKGRELCRLSGPLRGQFDLSPGGKRLAYRVHIGDRDRIRIYSLDGKQEREIEPPIAGDLANLDWSSDGKGLYVSGWNPSAGVRLYYLPLDGPMREVWRQPGSYSSWAHQSPDGKYLAILGATRDSNVWLLEGF